MLARPDPLSGHRLWSVSYFGRTMAMLYSDDYIMCRILLVNHAGDETLRSQGKVHPVTSRDGNSSVDLKIVGPLDPFQSGQYARYFVNGFEDAPEDPFHIQASACCKV